jgi:predicted nucleic acid-binding protein
MTPVPGAGSDIFLDANIFLHIILENPSHADSCTALLEHIESGQYRGISSIIVLGEVFHRTFISDVVASCRIEPASAPAYIKRHMDLLQKLPRAYESISTIKQMHNIRISDISSNTLDQALAISKKYSLLLNDALHIAVMREHEINCIATYDRDFERVPGIMITKP